MKKDATASSKSKAVTRHSVFLTAKMCASASREGGSRCGLSGYAAAIKPVLTCQSFTSPLN